MEQIVKLTLLEDFLLLALNDQTGQLYPLAPSVLDYATAGAILMDLTQRQRIDNDLRDMFVTDATPTGDDILDPALQVMSLAPVLTPHPIAYWLRQFADEARASREQAFRRLERRGIVQRKDHRILWVFGSRRYPLIDDTEMREVRSRILGAVLGDDIPHARDVMLTTLANSCGLFSHLLDAEQSAAAAPRIAAIEKIDLIGQAVAAGVAAIDQAVAHAAAYR